MEDGILEVTSNELFKDSKQNNIVDKKHKSNNRVKWGCGLSFNFDYILDYMGRLDLGRNSQILSNNYNFIVSPKVIGSAISNRYNIENDHKLWSIHGFCKMARVDVHCTYLDGELSSLNDHTGKIDVFGNAFIQIFYYDQTNTDDYLIHIYTRGQSINAIRNIINTEKNLNTAKNVYIKWKSTLRNKLIYMRNIYDFMEAGKWLYHYRLILSDEIISYVDLYQG